MGDLAWRDFCAAQSTISNKQPWNVHASTDTHEGSIFETNLDIRQLEDLRESIDAIGVGRECVQALAAEDGGGHSSQSVATQVQFFQLL